MQEIRKSCKYFLARLARSCTKNEAFLARYKNLVMILQEKIKIVSLQDFLSCFIFSTRLARYVQDLVQHLANLARKILARFAYFLQDDFYWAPIATYVQSVFNCTLPNPTVTVRIAVQSFKKPGNLL